MKHYADKLAVVGLLGFAACLISPRVIFAQDKGSVVAFLEGTQDEPRKVCMVSLIRDGEVVEQSEHWTGRGESAMFNVAPGMVEIRVEGDGIVTEVKRGIRIFPKGRTDLIFVPRRGTGVHVVEYATGALSSEEIAQRLKNLERAIVELQSALQNGLQKR